MGWNTVPFGQWRASRNPSYPANITSRGAAARNTVINLTYNPPFLRSKPRIHLYLTRGFSNYPRGMYWLTLFEMCHSSTPGKRPISRGDFNIIQATGIIRHNTTMICTQSSLAALHPELHLSALRHGWSHAYSLKTGKLHKSGVHNKSGHCSYFYRHSLAS